MKRILIILWTLFFAGQFFACQLQSQTIFWDNSIGIFGGGMLNVHFPSMALPLFGTLNKVPIQNTTSSLTGFSGIEGNFQLHQYIVLTGRVGYHWAGADFEAQTSSNTNNAINTSLQYLEFSPMLKLVNLIPNYELFYFTTGISYGLPIAANYEATQKTGRNERSVSGEIPNINSKISVPIGIGYIWRYNQSISIIPEVSYNLNLSDISGNADWSTWSLSQFKAGVSITYRFPKYSKKPKAKKEAIPTSLSIEMGDIYYVDNELQKQPINTIRIEEAEYGEYFPVLPYIFYDINETNFPETYKQQISASTLAGNPEEEKPIPGDAVAVSQQVLTVIGKRMQAAPSSSLTIIGAIDGKYETDTNVAKARAEEVHLYLTKQFDISPDRLSVGSVGLPAKPSAQTVRDGIVENRRVELYSDNPELFEPVFVQGEKKTLSFPDNVNFAPKINSNKPVTSWNLEIMQSDRLVQRITGDSLNSDSTISIEWDIAMNELSPSEIPLEYKLDVSTPDTTVSYIGYINTDYNSVLHKKSIEQPDYSINKYSLVLFDFDSPTLTDANKRVIDKFILPNIKLGSNIDIYGYTDRIGNSDYNINLSLNRAIAVKDYISSKYRNVLINTYGMGNTVELFDNEQVVGRQLSRTVQVIVVTPK